MPLANGTVHGLTLSSIAVYAYRELDEVQDPVALRVQDKTAEMCTKRADKTVVMFSSELCYMWLIGNMDSSVIINFSTFVYHAFEMRTISNII